MSALVPRPHEVVRGVRDVVGWTVATTALVASFPGRIDALLDEAEALVARIDMVTHRADHVVTRAALATVEVETVVVDAARMSATALELLDLYAPLAARAAPLAARFVDEIGEDEVHAAVALIDYLPELTVRMTAIMPILATLDTVAPEIHELLEVVKDVRQAIQGVPGFSFFRRRGEARDA